MKQHLIERIKNTYRNHFKQEPIIIKSPGRINLIGEHTDYNDGFVFPAAIDKAIIVAIQKSSTDFCTAIAADLNETYEFSLHSIESIPGGGWKNYIIGVAAEIQKKGLKLEPFNLVIEGDIPLGAGLSSSAALENAVVFGLNKLFDFGLDKNEMILLSQQAEHNYAKVKCGIMDMYASMFGKENSALLLDCRTLESKEFKIDFGEYQLVLINTNIKHSLSESAYNNRRLVCEKAASLLQVKALRDVNEEDLERIKNKIPKEDFQKVLYVIQENKRVKRAAKKIKTNDILGLGELLYESHKGLQNQYRVSCEELDFLVEKAKANKGVIGARMMGGGFGGCTLNIVSKNDTEKFTQNVADAYKKKFDKICSIYFVELSEGTHCLME